MILYPEDRIPLVRLVPLGMQHLVAAVTNSTNAQAPRQPDTE
jgi:hypothetical protein